MTLARSCLAVALCVASLAPRVTATATATAATAAAAPLAFEVDTSVTASVVYHVACLADTLPCTKRAFDTLWHEPLHWTRDDQAMLEAWQAIFARVSGAARPSPETPFVGNTLSLRPALQAQRTLLAALLDASSAADLQRRASAVATHLDRADAARLRDIVDHFRQRLRPWWNGRARARRDEQSRVEAKAAAVEALVRTPAISALVRKMATFVEADPRAAASVLRVHLVPSPEPQSDAASATVVANHLVIEVTGAAQVRGLAEIVVHETTHYLYDSASTESLTALMQQFASLGTPQAAPLYALENEAIATAAQMMAGKQLEGEAAIESRDGQETYRHATIPRAARAALRALEAAIGTDGPGGAASGAGQSGRDHDSRGGAGRADRAGNAGDDSLANGSLASGGHAAARTPPRPALRMTLRSGFTESYIREAAREFGADVERPSFLLTSLALLPTERAGRATAVFQQEIPSLNVAATNEWQRYSQLSVVFLMGHDELRDAFGGAYPDVPPLATTARGFAYRAAREHGASFYILSGRDEQALIDVVHAFARQTSLKPAGLLLIVD